MSVSNECVVALTEAEKKMILNSMAQAASSEVDLVSFIHLMDKIASAK